MTLNDTVDHNIFNFKTNHYHLEETDPHNACIFTGTMLNHETVIGIDLGQTNSVIAAYQGDQFVVIPDSKGNRLHPSMVAFPADGNVLAGHAARARRHTDPEHTIFNTKRLIGRQSEDPNVSLAMKELPYRCELGPDLQPSIAIRDSRYSVPELSAILIKYLCKCAENYLGTTVSQAVLTVPVNFTEAQREATRSAGELAGLEVLGIVDEPTAAALAYGLGKANDARVAVYDLSGHHSNITVLNIENKHMKVLASGECGVSGDDFDKAITNHLADKFRKEFGYDLRKTPLAWSRLRAACEQIKCRLSDVSSVGGTIHNLATAQDGSPVGLDFKLKRSDFDQMFLTLLEQSNAACRHILDDAAVIPEGLTDLILVGAATRIPIVKQEVEQHFHQTSKNGINPEEAVACGAALQAAELLKESCPTPNRRTQRMLDGAKNTVFPIATSIGAVAPAALPKTNKTKGRKRIVGIAAMPMLCALLWFLATLIVDPQKQGIKILPETAPPASVSKLVSPSPINVTKPTLHANSDAPSQKKNLSSEVSTDKQSYRAHKQRKASRTRHGKLNRTKSKLTKTPLSELRVVREYKSIEDSIRVVD